MTKINQKVFNEVKKLLDDQKAYLKKNTHVWNSEDMEDIVFQEDDLVETSELCIDDDTLIELRDLQRFMLDEIEAIREG